jgi:hypothetical protein
MVFGDARYSGGGSPRLTAATSAARGRSTRVRRAVLVLAAFALASLALVARADAFVYWANFNTGTIGRANLDGSGADQRFIGGASGPVGLAVDGAHVYWANFNISRIGRADLDGSGADQSFITGSSQVRGVAVDGANIYWTSPFVSAIGRADLDGSNVNQEFITGTGGATDVAVDGAHVYWANNLTNSIGRANLDGAPASIRESSPALAGRPGSQSTARRSPS